MNPEEQPSPQDRVYAAWNYVLPIVGPLYLIATTRGKPYLWRHAIQALAVHGLFTALIKALELFPPVAGITLAPVAIGIGLLALIACALLVHRGHALRLPWVADFADKWQGLSAGLIDAGLATLKHHEELGLHRRNLKSATAAPPKDVLPKVEGKPGMRGFQIIHRLARQARGRPAGRADEARRSPSAFACRIPIGMRRSFGVQSCAMSSPCASGAQRSRWKMLRPSWRRPSARWPAAST